jgi:hypothetical protein
MKNHCKNNKTIQLSNTCVWYFSLFIYCAEHEIFTHNFLIKIRKIKKASYEYDAFFINSYDQ